MMRDDDVETTPASVYRMFKATGRLGRTKGTGFVQLQRLHEHWPVEVSYINVTGMSYHLTSFLDGCSGAIETYDIITKGVVAQSSGLCDVDGAGHGEFFRMGPQDGIHPRDLAVEPNRCVALSSKPLGKKRL